MFIIYFFMIKGLLVLMSLWCCFSLFEVGLVEEGLNIIKYILD